MGFDIGTVREYARSFGWTEVQFNGRSRVIGFARNIERVNVYYTTRTVGTCTDHPRLGKTQLFRRNMSYDQLRQIFDNVRSHTGQGYYKKANFDAPENLPHSLSHRWWCTTSNGMGDLISAKHNYECKNYPIMVLGQSWLGINHEGVPAWGPGIPKQLDNKLRGRQNWLPTVDLVCLGPGWHDYFVQFADGTAEWVGLPDDLSEYIRKSSSRVQTIALGQDYSYFCQWDDGSNCWSGLPRALHNKLNGRQKSLPSVSKVNLGPNGEYFVLFEDGKWQSGGDIADACDNAIDEIHGDGGTIYDIQFGHDYTWMIRYTE